MPTDLAGDLYYNPLLTRAAVTNIQNDKRFTAARAWPRMIVDKPTGLYDKVKTGDLNRDEVEARGQNSPAAIARVGYERGTFSVPTESLAYDLNDVAVKASNVTRNPARIIPRVLGVKGSIRLERMMARKFLGADGQSIPWYRTVTGGASDTVNAYTSAGTRKYFNSSTDLLVAVLEEAGYISRKAGMDPDAMLFARDAWLAFRTNDSIIAALNGWVIGGGIELALACDIRVASDRANFGFFHMRRGMHFADGGIVRLVNTCGVGIAMELELMGEPIDAQRAKEIHLVNRVVPHNDLMTTAEDIAAKILRNPQIAVNRLRKRSWKWWAVRWKTSCGLNACTDIRPWEIPRLSIVSRTSSTSATKTASPRKPSPGDRAQINPINSMYPGREHDDHIQSVRSRSRISRGGILGKRHVLHLHRALGRFRSRPSICVRRRTPVHLW